MHWTNPSVNGATVLVRPGIWLPIGAQMLDDVLAEVPPPDVVVIALGTNDVRAEQSPAAVADGIRALIATAEAAGTVTAIATVPAQLNAPPAHAQAIDAINALIHDMGRPVIDFTSGFELADYYSDGLHFTDAGQAKRHAAATAVLW